MSIPDPSTDQGTQTPKKRVRPWRKNVLTLIAIGYVALLAVFFSIVWGENDGGTQQTALSAYETIKEPLMALIGGSLALAKDLVPLGTEEDQ
ncbi:MAG: hypothetical protein OXK20_00440 [Deltaproteobacteria bacterium]|nr:hypothetical protein [Deltaproteobacteria bacterium]